MELWKVVRTTFTFPSRRLEIVSLTSQTLYRLVPAWTVNTCTHFPHDSRGTILPCVLLILQMCSLAQEGELAFFFQKKQLFLLYLFLFFLASLSFFSSSVSFFLLSLSFLFLLSNLAFFVSCAVGLSRTFSSFFNTISIH